MQSLSTPKSDMLLGTFSVIAVLVFVVLWIWLKDEPVFNAAQRFKVIFHDSGGLNENAAVQVNGIRIGSVEKVGLGDNDAVVVTVRINSRRHAAPEGSRFEIRTNGLVGAKYLKVEPPAGYTGSGVPLLSESSLVRGQDPFQPEEVMKDVLEEVKAIKLRELDRRIESRLDRLALAADEVSTLTRQLQPTAMRLPFMIDESTVTMHQFGVLAGDLRGTTGSINRMLHHSGGKTDLKETAQCAFAAADRLRATALIMQGTLSDKCLRHDVLDVAHSLDDSSIQLNNAVAAIGHITVDPALASDLKSMTHDARDTVQGLNSLVQQPLLHSDLHCTLLSVQRAADRFDQIGAQVHQILNKRAPLLQLFFTRPGYIPCLPEYAQRPGCAVK